MCHCRCAAGWTVATCPLTSADVPTPAKPPAGVPRPATPPVRLSALLTGRGTLDAADVAVTGITAATDLVRPGDLFAGVPGRSAHGASFAAAAVAAGAVAVLTDQIG